MEARKLQRVGKSTYAVSLPRDWVKKHGLSPGNIVSVSEDSGGYLKIEPGYPHRPSTKCTINADLSKTRELLSRIITGCYVIGYDRISVVSDSELSPEQLDEVRRTVKRLRGLEIVDLSLKKVTIQSFVDPTRFAVDALIERLRAMVSGMLVAALSALEKGRPELANEALRIESDVDELYWLIVRQLLLALRHGEISGKIGIESPLHAVGDRMISKTLEEIGGFVEAVANELIRLRQLRARIDEGTARAVLRYGKGIQSTFEKTMKALFTRDIEMANEAIEMAADTVEEEKNLSNSLLRVEEARLSSTLRSIAWNFGQIARYCNMISEITFHRFLRQSSDICTIEELKEMS